MDSIVVVLAGILLVVLRFIGTPVAIALGLAGAVAVCTWLPQLEQCFCL